MRMSGDVRRCKETCFTQCSYSQGGLQKIIEKHETACRIEVDTIQKQMGLDRYQKSRRSEADHAYVNRVRQIKKLK